MNITSPKLGSIPGELLEAIAEAAPDALLVVDGDGCVQFANQACTNVFGYGPEEIVGLAIEDLLPARFRIRHRRDRKRYQGLPRPRPMGLNQDLWARRKDGSEVPVEVSLNPFRSGDRHLVAAAVRDVSELKRTRELLARSRRQAVLSELSEFAVKALTVEAFAERAMKALLEHLRADCGGICERGHDGRHLRFLAVGGCSAEEALETVQVALRGTLLDRMLSGAMSVHQALVPARRRPARAEHRGAIVALRGTSRVHGLLSFFAIDGREFTEDEVLFGQSLANLTAAVFDRQQQHSMLLQASKMDALGQLTGGIAHDFNNLLTVISGNLQILEDQLPGESLSLQLAQSAARAAKRGGELTAKLLAFSRRKPLQAQAIDLAQLLATIRDMLARTLGEGIELHYSVESPLPLVEADAAQVESAILNLALNARDAMPQGGKLTISVRLDRDRRRLRDAHDGTVMIEVSDTGVGMPRDVLARAIEPFFTTKGSGKGTGLGLSMVYSFMRQWGGDVRLYSEPGVGTTVKLLLPARGGMPQEPARKPAPRRMRGQEHVLVVEDDLDVCEVAVAQLRSLGYKVAAAHTVDAALAALAAEPRIGIVFSDVVLAAGETGFQLADRARLARPDLKFLFASGYAEAAIEHHFGARSRPPILPKPYTREELGYALRAVIDQA